MPMCSILGQLAAGRVTIIWWKPGRPVIRESFENLLNGALGCRIGGDAEVKNPVLPHRALAKTRTLAVSKSSLGVGDNAHIS